MWGSSARTRKQSGSEEGEGERSSLRKVPDFFFFFPSNSTRRGGGGILRARAGLGHVPEGGKKDELQEDVGRRRREKECKKKKRKILLQRLIVDWSVCSQSQPQLSPRDGCALHIRAGC